MDQPKPITLVELLNQHSKSLIVREEDGGISCVTCQHNFSVNKHFSCVVSHVRSEDHLTLLNWDPKNELTRKEFLQMHTYHKNYNQYIDIRGNLLVCKVCDNKVFNSSKFSAVKYHCNSVHSFKVSQSSTLGDITNVGTPKCSFPLGIPGSSKCVQHKYEDNEKEEAMKAEIEREENKDKPLEIVNNELMCTECTVTFNPQKYSSYYNSVRKHWKSKLHRKSVIANQSRLNYEKRQQHKLECMQNNQRFKGDGKLTPPKVPKIGPHNRLIPTSTKVEAAKIMLYGCHPLKTANNSMRACLVALFDRTLSPTSIDDGIDRCLDAAVIARRNFLLDEKIYISIDDTTHKYNWAAIEIGVLGPNMERFPIHVKMVSDKKGETFAASIEEVLYQIWPDGPPVDQVRLLLTDGASPMIKCGEILKAKYPKMYQVLCMAHKMHNIADVIKKHCPVVYEFTGLLKQVLARSKKRNDLFVKCTGGIKFPVPHDIRFGSWIRTDNFCCYFLPEIFNFIELLPPERTTKQEGQSRVNELKDFIKDKQKVALLKEYLDFIHQFYGELPMYIFEIEGSQVLLQKSIEIIYKVRDMLKFAVLNCKEKHQKIAEDILNKFASDMELNKDLWLMEAECQNDPNSIYHFAPVNSCGVERMFARFRLEFCHPKCHLSPAQLTKQYAVKVAFRADNFVYDKLESSTASLEQLEGSDDIEEQDQDVDYWQLKRPQLEAEVEQTRKYKLVLFGEKYDKPVTPSLDELTAMLKIEKTTIPAVIFKKRKNNENAKPRKRAKVDQSRVSSQPISTTSDTPKTTTLTTRSGRTARRFLAF